MGAGRAPGGFAGHGVQVRPVLLAFSAKKLDTSALKEDGQPLDRFSAFWHQNAGAFKRMTFKRMNWQADGSRCRFETYEKNCFNGSRRVERAGAFRLSGGA